jgi:hypothetical protein
MKFISEDRLEWKTEQQAKQADTLYNKMRLAIDMLEKNITISLNEFEKAYPHVEITDLDFRVG